MQTCNLKGQGSNPVGAEVINGAEELFEKEELLVEMELLEMVKALLERETLLVVENANEIVALD